MELPLWRHVRQRLSTQVVLLMVAILVLTMAGGFYVLQRDLRGQLNDQFERRALSIAQTLASERTVATQVVDGHPGGQLQLMAGQAVKETDVLFVVITNAQGIRYTHPDPALIGTSITYDDPESVTSEPFRTGRAWLGIQSGTLGTVAAGKAPLFLNGRLIGQVSVGFRVADVATALSSALPSLILYLLGVLAVGVLAALALARRLKRQTFGLELNEIAALLQEREAMLHGIKEAVLGYDTAGRVLLANDAARGLLGLPAEFAGRKLRYMLPPGRLADVVTGEVTGSDLLVLHEDRVLVANRMPITRNHQQLGWVVTFQDRTESETLKRALDEVTGLADTLRAQSHEFANRLHTLVGLVELGHYAEAVEFVTGLSTARAELTDRLVEAIGEPKLAALILAKVSLAAERDVELRLLPDSRVGQRITATTQVLTVVGNLIDNAIDAATLAPAPREVELTLVAAEADLLIRVRDTGPGVPHDMRDQIFTDGVTTKSSVTGARRGLGLALVSQIVEGMGGMVSVGQDGGAVFTAVLPGCLAPADPVPPADQVPPAVPRPRVVT
ncbi:MAG: two-component system, CitB family, sensor kinase [Trebonia sp.]|nr:two-component system, CitB family, sensor kinase [Trebonia sp.]